MRERNSALQQELAIGAQHQNFAPRQPRSKHQLVETVIGHTAFKDARKTFMERGAHGLQVDRRTRTRFHRKVVHPDFAVGLAIQVIDLERLLTNDFQPHILEHRNDIGERERVAGTVEFELYRVFRGVRRTIEVQFQSIRDTRGID